MEEQTPKKKRQYQYSSAQRAKIAAQRLAKTTKKQAQQITREANVERTKLRTKLIKLRAKEKEALELANKIAGKPNKISGNVVDEDKISVKLPSIAKMVRERSADIIFAPNPGPQTEFLSASETEVLYGGAAGGGKSYAMLADPLRYCHKAEHRGLLLRRTMPELLELIDKSRIMYKKAFPGAQFREVEKRWIFPSGASIQFSFVDTDQDVTRFQGQSFTWIGIDEITHYPTPYVWDYLRSRLRRTDLEITPYMRATANPGGIGGWWVKKMFVDPAPRNTAFWATDIEKGTTLCYPDYEGVAPELRGKPLFKRRFIPARLTDNQYLMRSPEYMAMLASLPDTQRRRLLEGDWDVADNCAFPEFSQTVHVIDQRELPWDLHRFRACDYGYVAPCAILWFAIDYDGTIIIYRELYEKGLDAEQLANKIHEIEAKEPRKLQGVLDSESWARRGQVGPSIAEVMIKNGINWRQADKGPGSRINGKLELHRKLATVDGKPKLQIMRNCINLIRTLPMLPLDEKNAEDVDTEFKEDHLYDALRYGIMTRQAQYSPYPHERRYQNMSKPAYTPSDSQFGY